MNQRNFFAELKRRNVYKVLVAYAVVAWLLIQAASILFPTFEAPAWAMKVFIAILLAGFPIGLVLAWAFEATPEGIERTEVADAKREHSRGRAWVYVVVIGAGLSLALFFLGRYTASKSQIPSTGASSKSIAVLPFENLSEDKSNAFFASGIQDEILTALSKISGLKVVSRTSTARFQSSPQNLSEIARALGVAHILEGSVQKAGDKVHVNVQLIRADTDEHLWAESYDRNLSDIFGVEAEVARSVADELRAKLSPEEKARVEMKPTENADAYVLYLRALEYERATDLLQDMQKAANFYTQAIALDPAFALARAKLSMTLAHIYLDYQPTDAIASRARSEAEEALRLQPDLGDGHHAHAMCLYWIEKDYAAALHELEVAARLLPNDADIEADTAYIHRRQGRWRDAIAGIGRALARDPRNAPVASEVTATYCYVHDWAAAAGARERAIVLADDAPTIRLDTSYIDVWWKGDLALLRDTLATIPAGFDPDGRITVARWDAALLGRDVATAERAVAACRTETVLSSFSAIATPKSYLLGCIALARGDTRQAKPLFESARATFEAETLALPREPFRHAQLGLLYAYLGRNDDAVREGRRAVELLPEARDAMDGPLMSAALALIYARTGQLDHALSLLERLLTTPAELTARSEVNITLAELRLRWQWDPLRNDPRFQKILASPEPKTIYN